MDAYQQEALLQAIAVSSLSLPQPSSAHAASTTALDRTAAFNVLEDFKRYDQRIPIVLSWLVQPSIVYHNQYDITVPTKLLALDIVVATLSHPSSSGRGGSSSSSGTPYANWPESDRLSLRHAVIQACQIVAHQSSSSNSPLEQQQQAARILSKKLAALLEGLVVRDFPQRWPTFINDVFSPMIESNSTSSSSGGGGLWYAIDSTTGRPMNDRIHLGVNICLECFKLIAEDCTDSDYNVQISTQRRNDVLIGLNEVSDTFLPLFYQLLQHSFPLLQQAKVTLHNMHQYLIQTRRTVHQLTNEERDMYQIQIQQRQSLSMLLNDALIMLEKCATSFPLQWLLNPQRDFVPLLLHLFRERDGNISQVQIQIRAVECIESLSNRGKLEYSQWMRLVRDLPSAVQQANLAFAEQYQNEKIEQMATSGSSGMTPSSQDDQHVLALQLDFHRAVSRMLASVISSHLSFLTTSKQLANTKNLNSPDFESLQALLRFMVGILHHPSGRMCSEQIALWTSLTRDTQIAKSRLLQPFLEEIMVCYMDQTVRVRWDDDIVENQSHPNFQILEASYDDQDDFDLWMSELRSRASNLFKFIGNLDPVVASRVLLTRVQTLLASHGSGQPLDHLDPSNQQLTQYSDAVLAFEAFQQPLENTLSGIPSWVLTSDTSKFTNHSDRVHIATSTRQALSELARELVTWDPKYLWLRFRRASLLESLKYIWNYDTSTLLQGIDSLLRYLGLLDEWQQPQVGSDHSIVSGETIGLKKKSGVTLVAIAKKIPQHLVPWLSQLSEATRTLLASDGLIPSNQMHLYEFLSCVAAAVQDPGTRSQFISDVLSGSLDTIESADVLQMIGSPQALLNAFGVLNATSSSVADAGVVNAVTARYNRIFTAFNRLLSVGRRCCEAAKQQKSNSDQNPTAFSTSSKLNFPDEGPVSIRDLAITDPYVPLWPRILPPLLTLYESILAVWRPEHQGIFLANPLQRYLYAISDDEAFLSRNQDGKSGGVFGEGGTAGSVVAGTNRRSTNLLPKWSGWFNELRNTCFQLLALAAAQRVLFSPEVVTLYPRIVAVITDRLNLQSMEHRHTTQFLKHVVELLLVCCPSTMYATHLAPIMGPIIEHMRFRLEKTWVPAIENSSLDSADGLMTKALTSSDSPKAAVLAAQGGDSWFSWYYAHAGLFVGDAEPVLAEAAVEKYRVELGRSYADVLMTALALKGEWALVLANQAKEEQAIKRNDPSILTTGPSYLINDDGVELNADGTAKSKDQVLLDAQKMLRINGLCHFLLLESEHIAFNLTLTVIQCLGYPDAYTCRRITKICHRVLETVAWSSLYSQILGQQMFTQAVKNIVTEPKWMVGVEWDVINVVRDIYCRLVLGQILQAGGQGPAQQQLATGPDSYEQAKTADRPLQGGGILTTSSPYPRQILLSLLGIDATALTAWEQQMKQKCSAKDQKDSLRDLLREAADRLQEQLPTAASGSSTNLAATGATTSLLDRALDEESMLHQHHRRAAAVIPDLPEQLVTSTQVAKALQKANDQGLDGPDGLSAFQL